MIEIVKDFFVETPALLWLCVLAIGIALECLIKNAHPLQSLSGYWLNFRHMVLYLLMIFLFLKPIMLFKENIYELFGSKCIFNISSFDTSNWLGMFLAAFIVLFVTDFLFYLWHRALHSISWLWDMHAVHHSDEEMNVLTGVRSHWTVFMFEAFTILLPAMIILGPSSKEVYSLVGISASWNFVAHSNIRFSFGSFSWVLVSPQLHRIHHSIYPEHRDKNFASLFPVWDIIFGTYYHPHSNEYPPTGIVGLKHNSLWQLSFYPIFQWIERINCMRRRVICDLKT